MDSVSDACMHACVHVTWSESYVQNKGWKHSEDGDDFCSYIEVLIDAHFVRVWGSKPNRVVILCLVTEDH